jgi:hypothetical protein
MAIKRKEDKPASNVLPGELDNMVHKAFTEQFLSSKYDDLFKDSKAEVLAYIEGSDDIEITQGEGFKTEYGSIILSERKNIAIDKSKLAGMIEAGELTVDQLLACVSTFKNEDLEKTLSSSKFAEISTKTATQTFTFKSTGDFKAQCETEFQPAPTSKETKVAPTPKAPAPKPELPPKAKAVVKAAADSLSAAEKAKAAVAKAKTKSSPTDDLDAILKPKKGK